MYYSINEDAARRAKNANSFSDYVPGSATAEYRSMIDEAAALVEKQKRRVDPMYHEKIDALFDRYARKLAENFNNRYAIDARVPSVMIAGPSNFPVRAKEKQNHARDRNMQEYFDIQELLGKIRSVGAGGITSDDPNALSKLRAKLADLEAAQAQMKSVNAYYRKNKTLDGCPGLSERAAEEIKAGWASGWYPGIPFPPYSLSNNNANIHRVRERIAQLEKLKAAAGDGPKETVCDGFTILENAEVNRIQFIFPGKPDEETRALLKSNGFRWAPSCGAWQRQLNANGRAAARAVRESLESGREGTEK